MKTHSLTLTPSEVCAALDDKLGLVVRPISLRQVHDIDDAGDPMRECRDGIWRKAPCPLGVPGDRLVCKETWKNKWGREFEYQERIADILYRADGEYLPAGEDPANERWRSPATMPAWASRITLEVEGVRVCRLLQLCEDDMRMALGVPMDTPASYELYREIRTSFEATWNRRYGRRYPWESNPWVWAVRVKRVQG